MYDGIHGINATLQPIAIQLRCPKMTIIIESSCARYDPLYSVDGAPTSQSRHAFFGIIQDDHSEGLQSTALLVLLTTNQGEAGATSDSAPPK